MSSAYWKLKSIAQEKHDQSCCSSPSSTEQVEALETSRVSQRCIRALTPAIPYLEAFLKSLTFLCDPQGQPDGYIPLCVAENKLVTDLLSERLMNTGSTAAAFSDSSVYGYNSFLGLPLARQAAAYFIAKRFFMPHVSNLHQDQALVAIDPGCIGICSGAASALHSLFYLLGNTGDACLIPAPYYAAFENDMSVSKFVLVDFAVHLSHIL